MFPTIPSDPALTSLLGSTRYGAVRRPGLTRRTKIPSLLNHRGPPPPPRPPAPAKRKKATDEDDYVFDPDYEALLAKKKKGQGSGSDTEDDDDEDDEAGPALVDQQADIGVVDDDY